MTAIGKLRTMPERCGLAADAARPFASCGSGSGMPPY